MNSPLLKNKIAIITGAAQGMGKTTAETFAKAGAKVVVADFNAKKGQAEADQINHNFNEKTAIFISTDISKAESVEALVKKTVSNFGKLDVAVNNAALAPDSKLLTSLDEDYWDKEMSVDLKGTALCLKYEIKQMIDQGHGGAIVDISSTCGFLPEINSSTYTAAKHGVIGLTKNAAMENGKYNIRVNGVAPGGVETEMLRSFYGNDDKKMNQAAKNLNDLGRFAKPVEIANASLFLSSELASFITGTTLQVDAGYTNMGGAK